MKKALITGITGQDGSYLAEFLLNKGYDVHGIIRRVALEDPKDRLSRIYHIKDQITLHPGTVENYPRMVDIFEDVIPDECYHLAAQSFVHESFKDIPSTISINVNGTHHILAALHRKAPKCKFYFAASSEMFGKTEESPQIETTRFHPRSPYGICKVFGFDLTRNYREAYNTFACSGILFNHESPRRGMEFVTRKITDGVARIKYGLSKELRLGNIDTKRDWGFSGDYVKAMWMMLQNSKPTDYVVATGKNHSIREFLKEAFNVVGLDYKDYVKIDQKFFRPAEVVDLIGDSSRIREELKWEPRISFKELVKMMVNADLKRLRHLKTQSQ